MLTTALITAVDVPMSRVRFNVNTEYAYIQNFKVLQRTSCPPPVLLRPNVVLPCLSLFPLNVWKTHSNILRSSF